MREDLWRTPESNLNAMPLKDANDPATWDLWFTPTAPRVQSHPEYTDLEWLQPDGSWGPIETRKEDPPISQQKRIRFSEKPLRWQVNWSGRQDLPEGHYNRRNAILAAHTIGLSDRILVVGAGTGATVKAFRDVGYTAVWGLDPSDWIHGDPARIWPNVVVIKQSIAGGNQLKAALRKNEAQGGTGDAEFDWIITDGVLSGMTDAELTAVEISGYTDLDRGFDNTDVRFVDLTELLLFVGRPKSNVVNLVQTYGDPTLVNLHTIVWWEALDAEQSWMENV